MSATPKHCRCGREPELEIIDGWDKWTCSGCRRALGDCSCMAVGDAVEGPSPEQMIGVDSSLALTHFGIGPNGITPGYRWTPMQDDRPRQHPEARIQSPWMDVLRPDVDVLRRAGVFPEQRCILLPLPPRRRWKRGQKLNRGGRRRARAKHAANQQEAFDKAAWERVTAPGGMNPPAFGSDEAWALLDEIRQRVFDAPKVPYPEAAIFGAPRKDGDK